MTHYKLLIYISVLLLFALGCNRDGEKPTSTLDGAFLLDDDTNEQEDNTNYDDDDNDVVDDDDDNDDADDDDNDDSDDDDNDETDDDDDSDVEDTDTDDRDIGDTDIGDADIGDVENPNEEECTDDTYCYMYFHPKLFCHDELKICVQCENHNQCNQAFYEKPYCNDNWECVKCLEDTHCLSISKSVCDLTENICVECVAGGDCPANYVCEESECLKDGADAGDIDDAGCQSDGWCKQYVGKDTPICNPQTKDCFECFCDNQCSPGYGCIENHCVEGTGSGAHIDCHTGKEIEEFLSYVSMCPEEPPDYIETSPECPDESRYIEEGWSKLGRVQSPDGDVSPLEWDRWKYPAMDVYISSFCMHINEVTNGEYKKCVEAGACTLPEMNVSRWREHYYDWDIYNEFPIVLINYHQAADYCEWIGGRLPTEAEWEKAARGPDLNWYPWGNFFPIEDLCEYSNISNYQTMCNADTCPVGLYSKDRSGYKINDMMGNISEYVMDWPWPGWYELDINRQKDPIVIEEKSDFHLVKGGMYFSSGEIRMRIEDHTSCSKSYASHTVGFRCVTWSAATLTPISWIGGVCENPPPEEFPEPAGFMPKNLDNKCVKWGEPICLTWEDNWHFNKNCGAHQLAWRAENSLEWSFTAIDILGDCIAIKGEGNGPYEKGVKYYIRLRPFWGDINDEKICSETFAEISLILAEDLESIECPSLEPYRTGNVNEPYPANATFECQIPQY